MFLQLNFGVQDLKVKLNLPWMDAFRIEFALGYQVTISVHGVPSSMIRVSPLEKYEGEWFIKLWLEDTREMMRHGLIETGVFSANAWYLWTLGARRDFYKSVIFI